jgi:hypothetical protein
MKPSPSKTTKAASGKKRAREEAAGSAAETPPVSPPRPDPNREWKKSKATTEDPLALFNSGFLREKEVDMWRAVAGDPYLMEKNPDEIPMFIRFVERGLSLPASDFFKGLLGYYGIEYLNLNPNGIFHTTVFVHFCEAFLGIKPHWILFWKFFRVKHQPSASNPRVVGGAGIQMREDAAEQYLSYKLIDSNQDWKAKWFYITNHHPELPKPSGKQPKHRPWWNSEPTIQEGLQLPELLAKIKALREAGLRAEHVAFSFMKRRVQSLMARDTLGYENTGDDDTSRMPGDEVDDDDIVDRLGRIFKDMLVYTPCPVPEFSAARPPKVVSSRIHCQVLIYVKVVALTCCASCRMTWRSLSPSRRCLLSLSRSQRKGRPRPRSVVRSAKETTQLSSRTRPRRMTMRTRSKSASNCGRGSAALDCRTYLLFRISQLVWRLACPRRQGSRAMWPASVWPRS